LFEVLESVQMMGAQKTGGSRMNQMGLSLQHLLWYADEGEDMFKRIVTGDKS
jgi:hypothetical protein